MHQIGLFHLLYHHLTSFKFGSFPDCCATISLKSVLCAANHYHRIALKDDQPVCLHIHLLYWISDFQSRDCPHKPCDIDIDKRPLFVFVLNLASRAISLPPSHLCMPASIWPPEPAATLHSNLPMSRLTAGSNVTPAFGLILSHNMPRTHSSQLRERDHYETHPGHPE